MQILDHTPHLWWFFEETTMIFPEKHWILKKNHILPLNQKGKFTVLWFLIRSPWDLMRNPWFFVKNEGVLIKSPWFFTKNNGFLFFFRCLEWSIYMKSVGIFVGKNMISEEEWIFFHDVSMKNQWFFLKSYISITIRKASLQCSDFW